MILNELRFILIILGVIAVGGLLLHGFWMSRKEYPLVFWKDPVPKKTPPVSEITDPTFSVVPSIVNNETEKPVTSSEKPHAGAAGVYAMDRWLNEEEVDAPLKAVRPVSLAVLYVVAHHNTLFSGRRIFNAFERQHLFYGKQEIFHRHVQLTGEGPIVFSVANMLKPGTFKLADPDRFTTRGITLFMQIYADSEVSSLEVQEALDPLEASSLFKVMLEVAQRLADALGGIVLDETRKILTPQRVIALRKSLRGRTVSTY